MTAPVLPPDILDAAARIVVADGPDALTMERLASATGLSRATLYRQCGSREAVLDALAASGVAVGDRSDARARIFAAAREVFGRAGFDGATVEQVATAANVGVATVYRYFGDKEGLVAAFLDGIAPRRAAREVRAAPSGELSTDLERLAARMLSGMREDGALMRILIAETLRGSPLLPRVRAMAPTRTLGAITGLFREHARELRAGLDPQLLAQAFGGMVFAFGVIAPFLRGEPAADPAQTARALTDLFLHGALAVKKGAR